MTITRVRYREGQTLRAVDLAAEQADRIAMRRRHNIGPHRWGIVTGLALSTQDGNLLVGAGMAIDGYGRELIVPEVVSVSLEEIFKQLDSNALTAWLLYSLAAETPPQHGRWDCGPGQHSRWREEARLRLLPVEPDVVIDARAPADVPMADLDFGAEQTPPDSPDAEWPVYLGRVESDGSSCSVNIANRPFVGARAEMVTAPSGRARMQVGSQTFGDRRRFAIGLPDATGAWMDRLAIDLDGNMTVRGDTTLSEGDLIIEPPATTALTTPPGPCDSPRGGETQEPPALGVEFEPMTSPPAAAASWQIYHAMVKEGDRSIHQLRFEIDHPGDKGDPTHYRLAIGHSDASGNFQPCLSVDANCTVTIHGQGSYLATDGAIVQGPIQADPNDPRFGDALIDGWVHGLAKSSTTLDGFYNAELKIKLSNIPASVAPGHALLYTIEIENIGPATVNHVHAYETLTDRGSTTPVKLILTDMSLAPGASTPISRNYNVPAGADGEITIAITALGVGPANNVIQTSVSQLVHVQQPGPQ